MNPDLGRIYLDNASTTPLDPRVFERMRPYLTENFGNASSIHSFGQQTKDALEDARERVAKLLGALPSEIFFTSGGTESDNLALKGVSMAWVRAAKYAHRPHRIISSQLEHKAVLESLAWLESFFGIKVLYVQHDSNGRFDLNHLQALLHQGVGQEQTLVSLMHANNELGNLNPIAEIAAIAKQHGALFHTDAVQTAGKLHFNVEALGVDLLSLAAHKFHGPKGVGVLYVQTGTPFESLFHGGNHERNRRAGTENYAAAIGLAEALTISLAESESTTIHVARSRELFLTCLAEAGLSYALNGDAGNQLPHIVNLSFAESVKDLDGDMLLLGLDAGGLAVSSGSACTSGTAKPSHVLMALGRSEAEARASVRFSFSKFTSEAEVRRAAQVLENVLTRFAAA
ncbi:MAG: cysteine desulfurase [Rhizobacter sp.]|nr:cysteine desulfurase [Chlorobiales bacterium]